MILDANALFPHVFLPLSFIALSQRFRHVFTYYLPSGFCRCDKNGGNDRENSLQTAAAVASVMQQKTTTPDLMARRVAMNRLNPGYAALEQAQYPRSFVCCARFPPWGHGMRYGHVCGFVLLGL